MRDLSTDQRIISYLPSVIARKAYLEARQSEKTERQAITIAIAAHCERRKGTFQTEGKI